MTKSLLGNLWVGCEFSKYKLPVLDSRVEIAKPCKDSKVMSNYGAGLTGNKEAEYFGLAISDFFPILLLFYYDRILASIHCLRFIRDFTGSVLLDISFHLHRNITHNYSHQTYDLSHFQSSTQNQKRRPLDTLLSFRTPYTMQIVLRNLIPSTNSMVADDLDRTQ
jgi:hypothetical protein